MFQRMETFQRRELESALREFSEADADEKEMFEQKLLQLRKMS
jgi:hypothetical protein